MKRYFTSDWHLNSSNINKYAGRPFITAKNALDHYLSVSNKLMKSEDTLIHVGDFILNGADRHDVIEDICEDPITAKQAIASVSANMILMSGNHDDGHNCETICKSMVIDLNHIYTNVYVNHFPSDHPHYHGLTGNKYKIQINLCGHVHSAWAVHYDSKKRVLNVNVGVDAWGYMPVRDAEITDLLDTIFDSHNTGVKPDLDFDCNWTWTVDDIKDFKFKKKSIIDQNRDIRKQERYLKKGLTPEECLRRKREGMEKRDKIHALREATGCGLTQCKQAFEACGYDKVEEAKKWLDEHGYCLHVKSA